MASLIGTKYEYLARSAHMPAACQVSLDTTHRGRFSGAIVYCCDRPETRRNRIAGMFHLVDIEQVIHGTQFGFWDYLNNLDRQHGRLVATCYVLFDEGPYTKVQVFTRVRKHAVGYCVDRLVARLNHELSIRCDTPEERDIAASYWNGQKYAREFPRKDRHVIVPYVDSDGEKHAYVPVQESTTEYLLKAVPAGLEFPPGGNAIGYETDSE